jgi:hypothetical protein
MMTPKQLSYENAAKTILKNMEKRNFTGSYAPTAAEALEQVKALLKPGMKVSNGGSETLGGLNFADVVREAGCEYLDRSADPTPEGKKAMYARIVGCDLFFMSTNALTMEGELVNVDGAGNRVACLAYGPEKVVIVAGMNKVTKDLPSALNRVKVDAAPPNCIRLGLKTPCSVTGVCSDCHSPDCICCNTVVTRHNRVPGRIHVILVGEELGY